METKIRRVKRKKRGENGGKEILKKDKEGKVKKEGEKELELAKHIAKHITLHANGKPFPKRSFSHSRYLPKSATILLVLVY